MTPRENRRHVASVYPVRIPMLLRRLAYIIAVVVIGTVITGYMLQDAWRWFVTPWAGVRAPSVAVIIGLVTGLKFALRPRLTTETAEAEDLWRTDPYTAGGHLIAMWVLVPLVGWAIMWGIQGVFL